MAAEEEGEPPLFGALDPEGKLPATLFTRWFRVMSNPAGFMSRTQRGQGMVEYALILVLVSIVVIVILLTMGNQIQNVFSNIVAALG